MNRISPAYFNIVAFTLVGTLLIGCSTSNVNGGTATVHGAGTATGGSVGNTSTTGPTVSPTVDVQGVPLN